MERIEYTCKKCGWKGSGNAAWGDIKPRRCPQKRCRVNFQLHPNQLLTKKPEVPAKPKAESSSPRKESKDERQTKKSYTSRKSKSKETSDSQIKKD